MPRDWSETDEDELRELEEKSKIPDDWYPSEDTIRAIEGRKKDVNEVSLAVQGFEKSEILSNEDVAEFISTGLPQEHGNVKNIEGIEYTDKYIGDEEGYIAGKCTTDEHNVSKIEINRQTPEGSDDPDEMKRTITHEVGHNVYYNLAEVHRDEWKGISSSSAPDEFVSDYAQTNEREDFAESYMTYVHDPAYLKAVSPAKYEFMRKHVFGGREY